MNLRNIFILTAIAGVFCITGCKKDDESSSLSFDGSLSFSLPKYTSPGETLTFHPEGLSRSSEDDSKNNDKTIGYAWRVDPFMSQYDTLRVEGAPESVSIDFEFTVPDTLCQYTVYVKAFAENYIGTTASKSSMIVNPERNTSLKGLELRDGDYVFVDKRDGKDYYVGKIGDLEWFRENLAYEEIGRPYENTAVFAKIFGCYYNWEEAGQACPEGWRLPSQEDWLVAARICADKADAFEADGTFEGVSGGFMLNAYFNGERMWEFWPAVQISDKTGISAIPMGFGMIGSSGTMEFRGVDEYANFWTADEYDEEQGFIRYIHMADPDLLVGSASKESFYASVRCVRDVNDN